VAAWQSPRAISCATCSAASRSDKDKRGDGIAVEADAVVTGDQNAGAVMITANMISGAKDGAIRALKLTEPCGADLALSKTENGRILIDRNLAI